LKEFLSFTDTGSFYFLFLSDLVLAR
jgi:hypothetical protein